MGSSKWKLYPQWMITPLIYSFTLSLSFLRPKHISHSIDSLSKLQSKRLVATSASLHIQTGLHCLIIHVLNTRACFRDIWCTSLSSVHCNLECGLAIVTESFSPLDLVHITLFVKVPIRSEVTNHAIPDNIYLSCALNWFELATAN